MILPILVGSGFLTSLMYSIEPADKKETKETKETKGNKTKKKKQ